MSRRQADDDPQNQAAVPPLHPPEPGDEFLLQALSSGATWAMEPLYHRYSGLLYTLAYRMLGERQAAEEVVQDAFLAVWQHTGSYSPQAGSVRYWLISIVRNRAIDYLRGMRRRSSWQVIPWEAGVWEENTALPDVWEEAWRSLQREKVREAVLHLPIEQRLVITLAFFRGWTHTEIAQRCHFPLGTVKARIRLGLLRLKQELEQQGVVETEETPGAADTEPDRHPCSIIP